ncbi:transcriptional regulator [Parabacteroides faecis]|uniref:transcriptional regulator n=1 Tax=Parabacteroides TaxID=375288 RepID=UPI000EFEB0B7|nr:MULTISPECIES: transcriptional regulator [Parabacteroides]MBC8617683.1 transcriptional regulator [Parabacteroides faecis]RHR96248.1 transcriptional regulator [Parabacteroides sp. AF14-59]
MYRLPLLFLTFMLTFFVAHASVAVPNLFVKNFTVDDYKASCQNWGLSVASDGVLYVANNSGLLTFDGNTWKHYKTPDNAIINGVTFLNDTIYTISENSFGGWTRDHLGVMRYHKLTKIPAEVKFKEPPAPIPFVLPDEILHAQPSVFTTIGDLYFIGTTNNGLYITSPEGTILRHLSTHDQSLPDNIIRAICIQDAEQIWIAFDNGISQISFSSPLIQLGKRSQIGKLKNATLFNDTLYIQTNVGYFKRTLEAGDNFEPVDIKKETFHNLPQNRAFDSLQVKNVFNDPESLGEFAHAEEIYPIGDNLYWLCTKNEAALFHNDGGKGTLKCRLLLSNYNMNLVNRDRKIYPLNDSLHLISAMQGVLLVNIRELIEGSLGSSTPLKISEIKYIDKNGDHNLPVNSEKITLPHNFQELTVYVGSTIFTPNHQISYMIEGVSSTWSPWQKGGEISFLQLPEGKYQLKIRKYVVKGPYPEIAIPITVRPPWYNTIWAWLIYIIATALIAKYTLSYHLKNLQREEKSKLDAKRQAEEQKIQEMKSKMLEAQLQNKNNELSLQTSALVKRNQAVQKLLDELEHQKEILGDRYPNKLYARMKSLMEESLNDQADWVLFETHFNSAHRNFIDRLRQQYDDITTGDLRICCLLRMNLSTKEIASLLNVSVRAIELRRYRLRKRLSLDGDTNLIDFLMNY